MRSMLFVVLAAAIGASSSVNAQSSRSTRGADSQVHVRPLDENGLRSLLMKRHGRPLLINVWATWCAPCVEEFPALVKVDSVYRARGLDVATISIDFEDDVTGKVVPFLKRQRARMPSYVNAFPSPSHLIDAIDSSWSGAVPATFLVDRRGRIVRSAIGSHTYAELSRWAEELLRQGSPRQ